MEFLRQEYWTRLPFPFPGDLPNPRIEPLSAALAGRFFTTEPPGQPPSIVLCSVKNTVRAGLSRKLNPKELMLSNCGVGEDSTHGYYQMVNTEIRLIIFFAAEDGQALYNQQKQDWEMTVAQIMNSYWKSQT